ncbi:unnamed protein product [Medioppia subpectinata]|uniref:Uncharacterized protein n=1 Tax=Medioppia subpectinata TaxID=1979941 RepID=A0A7R9KZQ9_9ACAR|nr:unnamed protein product [Medioppia subpectinata]CAG2112914.1 unnamed protein product [Medioppia subpectinata]
MKNWITIHTIIRPFLDNHFNLEEFIDGSKQALIHISHCLADGNLDSLKDVISDEALIEIRHNFPKLNAKQIEDLRIVSTDILYSFVHTIGIIMNDNNNRWVEITVVYYCLHKYQTLSERKEISFEDFKEKFGPNITICNYRFIRDYTKGVENDWTVNLLAHFTKDNF